MIYFDEYSYAIAGWGVERAAGLGATVMPFRHHDAAHLRTLLARLPKSRTSVIVTDGFCTECGEPAPLTQYQALAAHAGGYLVLDDTQALGVLGPQGGGSLRAQGVESSGVIVVDSLAKGFGAPLAVLAGSARFVRRFRASSQTRLYASPPSQPALLAAREALDINRQHGVAVRRRLFSLVARFRRDLAEAGIPVTGGRFPVQSIAAGSLDEAQRLHAALLDDGVRGFPRVVHGGQAQVSFAITAEHDRASIDFATTAIARVMAPHRKGYLTWPT